MQDKSDEDACKFKLALSLFANDFTLLTQQSAKLSGALKQQDYLCVQAEACLLQSLYNEGTKPVILDMGEMFVKKYATAKQAELKDGESLPKNIIQLWFNIKN